MVRTCDWVTDTRLNRGHRLDGLVPTCRTAHRKWRLVPRTLAGSKPCKEATKLPRIVEMLPFLKIKETIQRTGESVFSGIPINLSIE